MKKKTFVIRNENVINQLVYFLKTWPEDGELWEVVVRLHKKDRSLAQNTLYWMWATIIGNELGLTKEDVHEDLKKRMLVPIYERDDDGYCAMVNTVRKLYTDGFREDSKMLAKGIVRLTSTTNASVQQFSEYLSEIEKDMIQKNIILPHPDDLYHDAMGYEDQHTGMPQR